MNGSPRATILGCGRNVGRGSALRCRAKALRCCASGPPNWAGPYPVLFGGWPFAPYVAQNSVRRGHTRLFLGETPRYGPNRLRAALALYRGRFLRAKAKSGSFGLISRPGRAGNVAEGCYGGKIQGVWWERRNAPARATGKVLAIRPSGGMAGSSLRAARPAFGRLG